MPLAMMRIQNPSTEILRIGEGNLSIGSVSGTRRKTLSIRNVMKLKVGMLQKFDARL